ncbi:G-type lectin S-receptor-like serine/threonine-protein kinase SD2-5 [Ricinus communis]|uniref:Sugar binding protein, putative n=1 Tax=Ricinus communis TaxID=3988 RepID=B9SZ96_RICCO|nr:G-type lectin S-receptor-like serine/threonine-protein kinase SD2-5 [Ricinus communis]EEF31065.1 sugar binding protein, putative [Ricinus communis]|eukprot:XP_002531315.1 G-type lectin S-receptor-like serine/threonine-protein kinase SD2-5 [Ricinus communis]
MEFSLLGFLLFFVLFAHALCKSDIHIGHRVTLAVPVEYSLGIIGRAFLMETYQSEPKFKVALSVVPINGKYSCSLEVFLGDVKVWNSGHYSPFFTSDTCVLELTKEGDLQLKGPKELVGWRTGTSGQGVERLQILGSGNLVLVDNLNRIKWQSFNFPTDVMLWGQRLNVATRLISFPMNSSAFYSFEIQRNKIALYLNSGKWNYSYWEFKPSKNRNISFIQLGTKGLELFNDKYHKIAQISSLSNWLLLQPLRFLALGNKTGNLGLYFYSPDKERFEAAFQALNTTCDLPLACKPYGICTFSNTCSCIRLLTKENEKGNSNSDCSEGLSREFCGKGKVEMLELNDVGSVLSAAAPTKVNISKEDCADSCLQDCKCVAALYSSVEEGASSRLKECFLYGLVMGAKQVERGTGFTYMVKVPKGTHVGHGKSGLKKWVIVLVGVIDSFIILLLLGGLGYYLIRKRRKNIPATSNTT